jgi:hypothetical protein
MFVLVGKICDIFCFGGRTWSDIAVKRPLSFKLTLGDNNNNNNKRTLGTTTALTAARKLFHKQKMLHTGMETSTLLELH